MQFQQPLPTDGPEYPARSHGGPPQRHWARPRGNPLEAFRRVGMRSFLDSEILRLFEPLPPIKPTTHCRTKPRYKALNIAAYVEDLRAEAEKEPASAAPTGDQKKLEARARHEAARAKQLEELRALYAPRDDAGKTRVPEHTVFLYRMPYTTTKPDVRAVMERFGAVVDIRLVIDPLNMLPRGYAFVEFATRAEAEQAAAARSVNIRGFRTAVDFERSRTEAGWLPRRLGGGLGGRRTNAAKGRNTHTSRSKARRDQLKREKQQKMERSRGRPRRFGRKPARGFGGRRDRRFPRRQRDSFRYR